MKIFNFDYDYENDSLFLYNKQSKSKGSIEVGNLLIDFNSNKEIVGIEMVNASSFLENTEGNKITKELLRNIKESKVEIVTKNNFFVIKIALLLNTNQKIMTAAFVPMITESSPALAKVV